MNSKKYLKKKYQETAEQILQENQPFYDEMMERFEGRETAKKGRKTFVLRWVGAVTGVAAAFACVFVPLYYTWNGNVQSTFPLYNGVMGSKNVTIGEWTEGSKEFAFTLDNDVTTDKMELNYDIETGDPLYYLLKYRITDIASSQILDVRFYPNPYYRDLLYNIYEGETVELGGLTLIYNESTAVEDEVIYSYNTLGKIEQGDEMIFFRYSETSLNSQSGFIEFVQEFVQKK